MKTLYKLYNELLEKDKQKILPEGDTDVNLAYKFFKYFDEKVMDIYNSFVSRTIAVVPYSMTSCLTK